MIAAQIVVDIVESGGSIRLEAGRIKVSGIPAWLVPLLRAHKTELLALLSAPTTDEQDCFAIEERLAIQEEETEVGAELPDIPVAPLDVQARTIFEQYGAEWQRAVDNLVIVARNPNPAMLVEEMGKKGSASPISEDSGGTSSPSASVRCKDCKRFQPGSTLIGIGTCLVTVTGLPPSGGHGYKAAFPLAPRRCSEYLESSS
ncbi:hypothetical protein HAP94_08085 [Acidithiobacillus ferrivorans]|nr:hypothetical protein [Acidithiobacillus ferrivorans]